MTNDNLNYRHDLRRRLRRMGLVKGVQALATSTPRRAVAIESLVPGSFHDTPHGRCFVAAQTFPLDYGHGDLPLGAFLGLSPRLAADIGSEPGLADVDLRRVVFLDTETTGLSGGTGTMAFLVGLGFFEDAHFHLLQAFLRDPGDEPAMVAWLADLMTRFDALVTFNGRGFDVPILETRFILARRPFPMSAAPHLDLLAPARRLWRLALPSCSLGTLEEAVLGVRRDQADVPSGVIPTIYREYLQTDDARDIARILYHNQIDVLSMVTLAARIGAAFAAPWDHPALTGAEFYMLSRWYESTGGDAERALRRALALGLPRDLRLRALEDMARLLRRTGRHAEAVAWWQQLAVEDRLGILAPVELAKYFEWHVPRPALAVGWTELALARARRWSRGAARDQALSELAHRLARLERKRP